MEGSHRSQATFYRCRARSLAPESPALQDHPANVYLREDHLTVKINSWIARLFAPAHIRRTVEELADADELAGRIETQAQSFRRCIAAAESTMERLRRAIEVGWDPETLTEQYNAAAADKRAAEVGLKVVDPVPQLTADDIRTMVTQLGDMAKALDLADRHDFAELYEALGLTIAYDHRLQVAEVSITPALRGVKKCVRGQTRTLTTRLDLAFDPAGRTP
ncbi:hypothetical protein JOF29_003706 [Kribbella aluminosa]|uniref:Uncharacterized protein n=1 Tax=Kribbella aluminosa TaxID=416017 RepID=A0ABS4ULU4_9ACTN|nr:hypothetical protein [Kribbella aluminosa]MBP2352623.1 hypothetical protein [Kribbella aluminosa]